MASTKRARKARLRGQRVSFTPGRSIDPVTSARIEFALSTLAASGKLKGSRTERLSARVDPGLIKAARAKTGLGNDSELVNAALAVLAAPDDFGPWFAAQAGRLPKDFALSSDVQSIIARHDPGRWLRTLVHRPKADLPFDPFQIPTRACLLFDATVYIDQLKGELPRPIVDLVAARTILHGAPALAELAVTIGALEPTDRRTRATLTSIVEVLTRINPSRIIVPNYEIWLEAAVMAGILARTQAIPKQERRKFLNDTLLFLQAADTGAVMISRNSRDLDLLLQIKPQVGVLLYDKS